MSKLEVYPTLSENGNIKINFATKPAAEVETITAKTAMTSHGFNENEYRVGNINETAGCRVALVHTQYGFSLMVDLNSRTAIKAYAGLTPIDFGSALAIREQHRSAQMLMKMIEDLRQELSQLRQEVHHMPGGSVYEDAKSHFEESAKQ